MSSSSPNMEINPPPATQPTISIHNTTSPSDFHITTPRLYISHQDPANDVHCDLAVALMHSASYIKYHPDGPSLVPDREAARAIITARTNKSPRTGYGRYLVSLRTGGAEESERFGNRQLEHIGYVSMQLGRHPSVPGPLIPDVGFNFLPKYHGKGFAGEAAACLMQYFRETKGWEKFAGITDEENVEAKRMLGRLGMREWGVRSVKGVIDTGPARMLSVWTVGVGSLEELESVGL